MTRIFCPSGSCTSSPGCTRYGDGVCSYGCAVNETWPASHWSLSVVSNDSLRHCIRSQACKRCTSGGDAGQGAGWRSSLGASRSPTSGVDWLAQSEEASRAMASAVPAGDSSHVRAESSRSEGLYRVSVQPSEDGESQGAAPVGGREGEGRDAYGGLESFDEELEGSDVQAAREQPMVSKFIDAITELVLDPAEQKKDKSSRRLPFHIRAKSIKKTLAVRKIKSDVWNQHVESLEKILALEKMREENLNRRWQDVGATCDEVWDEALPEMCAGLAGAGACLSVPCPPAAC
eukprot:scaffold1974_cov395-Prasinococcus_capsulatus_cf.AAC.9